MTRSSALPPSSTIQTIRAMRPGEMHTVMQWSTQELQDPGLHDHFCLYQADPQGFFVVEQDQQLAGAIAAMRCGPQLGHIGLWLVHPDFRGQGLGRALLDHALRQLDTPVGVTVPRHLAGVFSNLGFTTAFQVHHCMGRGFVVDDTSRTTDFTRDHLAAVTGLDELTRTSPRPAFLTKWIERPGVLTKVRMQGSRCMGFGTLRPCVNGNKIGPLAARSEDEAYRVMLALATARGGDELAMEVPDANARAVRLASRFNLEVIETWVRMYSGSHPLTRMDYTYALTSLELG